MIDHPFQNNTTGMIIFITLYRCFYQVIGSYITAMLAPHHPMGHVWIGGFIGLALSIIGSIVMKEEGPAWYAYALIILALPTTWIGGNLYLRKKIIS